ncbi:MAG TPA: ribonuclease III [Roseiflexaceae bacterium]|nr:ribonuclease III [Roseiflexaceae bacterium]
MPSIESLQTILGVSVRPRLLEEALTHRSYLNERVGERLGLSSNERLEFLGDSIVNAVAAALLYEQLPEADEGQLTAMRTRLIRTETLAEFARRFDLGRYIRMGRGEELGGARDRDAMLADTFEALVAALFLEGGLAAAQALLVPLFEQEIAVVAARGLQPDYKSALLARIQAERTITPRYRTVAATGPEHRRAFTVEVLAGDEVLGVGQGMSKQAAAQAAARAALERLDAGQSL